MSFGVDEGLWREVKVAAVGEGLSVTRFVTGLLERELGYGGSVGSVGGERVGASGAGSADHGGRVGDDDPECGVGAAGFVNVPDWAKDIRKPVHTSVQDVVVEPDPLSEIA